MIPFGPMKPDQGVTNAPVCLLAQNVLPLASGYGPMPSLVKVGAALGDQVLGGIAVRTASGTLGVVGTASGLFKQSAQAWELVSPPGRTYNTSRRWSFAKFGNRVVASNGSEPMAYLDINDSAALFVEVPQAPIGFHMAVVRDFLVVGDIFGHPNRVQWSGSNNMEQWTVGENNSDFQDLPSGNRVQGLIGGETGYVFDVDGVTRMVLQPGSQTVFNFDEVEGGRGVLAPYSITRTGRDVYYLSTDGFYKMDYGSGAAQPLGVGDWRKWFASASRPVSRLNTLGIAVPDSTLMMWAFTSIEESTITALDKILVYDWSLNAITVLNIETETLAPWLTPGFSLEELDSFGTMETLPASLDSPVWQGGVPQVAFFGSDRRSGFFVGAPMEALLETADGELSGRRALIRATTPKVDATTVRVQVSGREAHSERLTYDVEEALEPSGEVPAWVSGNVIRARVRIPAGSSWTYLEGLETNLEGAGRP